MRLVLPLLTLLAAAPVLAQSEPEPQELMDESFGAPAGPAPPPPARIAPPPAAQATPPAAATDQLSPRHAAGANATVGGRYRTQGRNLNGAPYEGEAEISVSGRDKCRIAWRTGSSSVQRGVCMRSGYVFVAAYQFRNGTVGLITYEIQPDGVLKGVWTIADTDGRGVEVLTPLR